MLKKIQNLCIARGINVAEFERILKFGSSTISKWRVSSPSVDKLKKVADYFGVSIEYFLEES